MTTHTHTKACELLRLYKATFALCSRPSSFPFFLLVLAKGGVDDIKSFTHSLFDATTTLPVSVGALVDVDFSIFFSLRTILFCEEWLIKSAKVFHCHHLPAILSPSLSLTVAIALCSPSFFFFFYTRPLLYIATTRKYPAIFFFFIWNKKFSSFQWAPCRMRAI